jgi:putative ABC transport system permease protein
MIRDFAYAWRTLRKSPAFAVTAVLTIALGIGASTAIFSVVNAVLLKPLPYPQPERLAILWGELRNRGVMNFPFSPPDFDDVRSSATLLEVLREDLGRVARVESHVGQRDIQARNRPGREPAG